MKKDFAALHRLLTEVHSSLSTPRTANNRWWNTVIRTSSHCMVCNVIFSFFLSFCLFLFPNILDASSSSNNEEIPLTWHVFTHSRQRERWRKRGEKKRETKTIDGEKNKKKNRRQTFRHTHAHTHRQRAEIIIVIIKKQMKIQSAKISQWTNNLDFCQLLEKVRRQNRFDFIR